MGREGEGRIRQWGGGRMYPEAPSSKNEETEMLLNKTWVPLPMGRKAHLLTLGVVKARAALIAGTTQSPGELKRPAPPEGCQGKIFKDRVSERGCEVCDQLTDVLLIGC